MGHGGPGAPVARFVATPRAYRDAPQGAISAALDPTKGHRDHIHSKHNDER